MFIVFEGLDGSGKSTQTNLLMEHLKKEGYEVAKIDFPQYGTKSAGLVEEYLNGKYGTSINIGPYRASIFYACDRYDASFKIKKWINEGKIVVCDRYVSSNAGHQGGKIKDKKERGEFLKWLYNLEYGIFGIPKPDFTFFLKTSPEFSLKLAHKITDEEKKAKRKAYLGDRERDIHEEDRVHLTDALNCYIEIAEEFPKEFKIIECLEGVKLLPPEAIHGRVWKLVSEMLKK
jgi:dTMP kinase